MSGMFNMSVTQGVKSSNNYLRSGIHNVVFKGIEKQTVDAKSGESYVVMAMRFSAKDYEDYVFKLFQPTSTERKQTQFGENPSQFEQFMIICRHLLDIANPEIAKGIDDGTVTIDAATFDDFIKKMQEYTNDFIGKPCEIKLLPNKDGYSQFPGFPAKINKNGQLYLSTKFIGKDLVLSPYEKKAIDNATNAKPTDMKSITENMLGDFGGTNVENVDDDLPF